MLTSKRFNRAQDTVSVWLSPGMVPQPSNYGVSLFKFVEWQASPVKDPEGALKDLDYETAKQILYSTHWATLRCEELPIGVDLLVYAFSLAYGIRPSATALQQAVNADRPPQLQRLAVDGIIGSKTINAVWKAPQLKLIERLHSTLKESSPNAIVSKNWSDLVTRAKALMFDSASRAERSPVIPSGMIFVKPRRSVDRVFLHCSASSYPHHDDVSVIDEWHRGRGWDECGYHYFIQRDGTVQTGRSIEKTPAAQAGHNKGTIAICMHGGQNGVDDFSHAQREALRLLCLSINQAYEGEITFHGHTEVANKDCPVYDYLGILDLGPQGHILVKRRNLGDSRTIRTGRTGLATSATGAVTTIAVATNISTEARETAAEMTENVTWLFAQPWYVWAILGFALLFVLQSLYFSRINFFRKQDHERGYR